MAVEPFTTVAVGRRAEKKDEGKGKISIRFESIHAVKYLMGTSDYYYYSDVD